MFNALVNLSNERERGPRKIATGCIGQEHARGPTSADFAPSLWVKWRVPSDWYRGGDANALLPGMVEAVFAFDSNHPHFDANVERIDAGYYSGKDGAVVFLQASLKRADTAEGALAALLGSCATPSPRSL